MNFSSEASSTVDGVTPGTTSATYRYNVEATFCMYLVELQKNNTQADSFYFTKLSSSKSWHNLYIILGCHVLK